MLGKIFFILLFSMSICYNLVFANDYKTIKSAIKKEEQELSKLKDTGKDLARRLVLIESKLNNHRSILRLADREIYVKQIGLENVLKDIKRKEREIVTIKLSIKRSMIYLSESAEYGMINILIGLQDANNLIASMEILSFANDRLFANIDRLDNDLIVLADLKLNEEEQLKSLSESRIVKEEALNEISKDNKRYSNILSKVRKDTKAQQRVISNLKKKEADLERALRDSRARKNVVNNSRGSGFGMLSGKLSFPIKGEVIDRFGNQLLEDTGVYFFNKGLKIETKTETDVIVPYNGTVQFADYIKGFLYLVVVSHDGGYYTVYGNMNRLKVSQGDSISKGAVVGVIDAISTSPSYLYLEVRKGETALDPLLWFK